MIKLLDDPSIKPYLNYRCYYPENYTVVHEKDNCTKIGIILKGELQMMHYSKEGKDILLGELKVGDVFGDFLLFSHEPYFPGHIIVKKAAEIIYINKPEVEKLFADNAVFRLYFLSNISSKAIKLNYHNKLLNLNTIEDKVIFFIEKEMSRLNQKKVPIKSKVSLAKYLNVQRPSLSRALKTMKSNGILDYNRDFMWLLYK